MCQSEEATYDWRFCRAQFDIQGCPEDYITVYIYFYWILFILYSVVTVCVASLACYYFPATERCGRPPKGHKLAIVLHFLSLALFQYVLSFVIQQCACPQ